jgi:hypothetical protein
MTGIDLLGFAAGTLTTCAFWPQLQKTWVSKSAGDVSMGMLGACPTLTVLLRRMIRDHLGRSRPEQTLNVPQGYASNLHSLRLC